ncbi:MAG: tetratricopeptide repeat protein, partial [Candidatus Odinarchaeota archaeon]
VEEIANKVVFLKFIETIEKLIEEENYNDAINELLELYNEAAIDDNNLKVLFLLGKTNFLKGRYDLAINFLFKLVKIRFDYPDGFLLLGRAYEKIGLKDKAQWAYDRIKESK